MVCHARFTQKLPHLLTGMHNNQKHLFNAFHYLKHCFYYCSMSGMHIKISFKNAMKESFKNLKHKIAHRLNINHK